MMMQILMVNWNYPPKVGGMESMIFQIVKGLRQTERVDVIGPSDSQNGSQEKDTFRPNRSGLIQFMMFSLMKGLQISRQSPPDVIVGGSALVLPILYLLSLYTKRPFVVIVHGLDLIFKNPLYQFVMKTLLPKADHLIANSSNSKNLAIERGVAPKKITVIPPGVNYGNFSELLKEKTQSKWKNRKIILSVGRLAKRKGIAEFVANCMPLIKEQCPEALFLIVGHNPTDALMHKEDLVSQIKTEVHNYHLEENVQLLGRVNDEMLSSLYNQCHFFILPAIDVPGDVEGFGIVLMEAASAGKPVISTRIGGISDAVVNGETGILVEAGDWDGMETAVFQLLNDAQLRKKLGQQAQRRAKETFDWPIVISQHKKLLQQIIDS